MCGIFGFITPGEPLDRVSCETALQTLQHRGPDALGVATGRLSVRHLEFRPCIGSPATNGADVFLGHTRLAILDLSDSALQPMANETGDVWIVFNGEIYNHAQLRVTLAGRGHVFRTHHADTEVLVHGFEEWGGAGLLDRIRGMFAMAILDLRRRQLFLARDAFGEKPLYVANDRRGVVFASELKAIQQSGFVPAQISRTGLADYLRYGYVPAPASILDKVWKVQAAEMATIDLGDPAACAKRVYWRLRDYSPVAASGGRWFEEFDARLAESVRAKSISDVPVGAFLSGGLDSSSVVRHMAAQGSRPRTFTIGFPGHRCDESEYARQVALRYGTEHEIGQLSAPLLLEQVTHAARIFDEPFADSSALPMILLARIARGSVTVALSGDGGDELLGGYTRYRLNCTIDGYVGDMANPLGRGVRRLAALWPHTVRGFGLARLLSGDAKARYQALLGDDWLLQQSALDATPGLDFETVWDPSIPGLVNQMCATDTRLYLPEDLMVKVDRVSMAAGLEVRAPFLDRDLFEFVARAPVEARLFGRAHKAALRKALAADLGESFTTRAKQGFQVPLGAWFRGPLRERALDTLSSTGGFLARFFPVRFLTRLVDDHQAGSRDQSHWIWLLLALEHWHDAHAPSA
jgi:asparagine synthase (glutamine-hydrolysing)